MKFVTYRHRDKEYPGVLSKDEKSVYSLDRIFGVGRFASIVDFIENIIKPNTEFIITKVKSE